MTTDRADLRNSKAQNLNAGTSARRPELISQTNASVFVSARLPWSLAPPAEERITKTNSKESL